MIQQWCCKEKLDASYPQGSNGLKKIDFSTFSKLHLWFPLLSFFFFLSCVVLRHIYFKLWVMIIIWYYYSSSIYIFLYILLMLLCLLLVEPAAYSQGKPPSSVWRNAELPIQQNPGEWRWTTWWRYKDLTTRRCWQVHVIAFF